MATEHKPPVYILHPRHIAEALAAGYFVPLTAEQRAAEPLAEAWWPAYRAFIVASRPIPPKGVPDAG